MMQEARSARLTSATENRRHSSIFEHRAMILLRIALVPGIVQARQLSRPRRQATHPTILLANHKLCHLPTTSLLQT
jgi:hypothetical protein